MSYAPPRPPVVTFQIAKQSVGGVCKKDEPEPGAGVDEAGPYTILALTDWCQSANVHVMYACIHVYMCLDIHTVTSFIERQGLKRSLQSPRGHVPNALVQSLLGRIRRKSGRGDSDNPAVGEALCVQGLLRMRCGQRKGAV